MNVCLWAGIAPKRFDLARWRRRTKYAPMHWACNGENRRVLCQRVNFWKNIFRNEVRRKNVKVNFFKFFAVKPAFALRSQLGAIGTLMANVCLHILRQFWTGKRILAHSMGVGGLPPTPQTSSRQTWPALKSFFVSLAQNVADSTVAKKWRPTYIPRCSFDETSSLVGNFKRNERRP